MTQLRLWSLMVLLISTLVTLASCSSGNQQRSQPAVIPDNRATDESTIRTMDADWVKAIAGKDAQQTASYYAEDGSLLAPGAPLATGRAAVQKTWAGLMATPGFALSFAPTKIEVSRAGDLAYEIGNYELTTNTKGKPKTVKAKYVVVWGKQPDGSWKALADAPTTTQ
jgi:uncharacterized protein (TIGR02246 family)